MPREPQPQLVAARAVQSSTSGAGSTGNKDSATGNGDKGVNFVTNFCIDIGTGTKTKCITAVGPKFGTDFGKDFGTDFGPNFGTDFGPNFGTDQDFGTNFGTYFGTVGTDFGTDFARVEC